MDFLFFIKTDNWNGIEITTDDMKMQRVTCTVPQRSQNFCKSENYLIIVEASPVCDHYYLFYPALRNPECKVLAGNGIIVNKCTAMCMHCSVIL